MSMLQDMCENYDPKPPYLGDARFPYCLAPKLPEMAKAYYGTQPEYPDLPPRPTFDEAGHGSQSSACGMVLFSAQVLSAAGYAISPGAPDPDTDWEAVLTAMGKLWHEIWSRRLMDHGCVLMPAQGTRNGRLAGHPDLMPWECLGYYEPYWDDDESNPTAERRKYRDEAQERCKAQFRPFLRILQGMDDIRIEKQPVMVSLWKPEKPKPMPRFPWPPEPPGPAPGPNGRLSFEDFLKQRNEDKP